MSPPNGRLITAVILTHNEEINLPACLGSLRPWCSSIFVVDSGSSDQTVSVAQRCGAQAVHHPFETHAKQWNWAFKNLPISGEWILALDADQRVTTELREEILGTLPVTPPQVAGYYLPRKQFFRGRWIRHGGYWPKYMLKLFRRGAGLSDEQERVDFRFYVKGPARRMKSPLLEDNRKEQEISFWLAKHLRFIELQAQEEFLRRHGKLSWALPLSAWGTPDQQTLWLKSWWYRLPPLLRPYPYFFYRYFVRLGFLDGPQGSLFHFLQGFWYPLMIGVRLKELEALAKTSGREIPF